MDFALLDFFKTYGSTLALLGTFAALLLSTRFVSRVDHEKAVSSLDGKFTHAIDKVDKAEDRISKIEHELGHLPSRETVHRMELALSDMRGEMRALGEQLKPVAAISDRLQEFLLEQGNKR